MESEKKMKQRVFRNMVCLAVFSLLCGLVISPAFAAVSRSSDYDAMRELIIKAVSTHPEVQSKWHSFQASGYEKEAAKGGYRPKLDVTAGIGRESLDGKGYSSSELFDYTHSGVSVFLTQMLYDGNFTNSSVRRFDHLMRMRYFDLMATMEQSALAAIHVQADLIRYGQLVRLARENLDRHIALMKKVEERTAAGLDSAVNLETAKGRLALARVNLITEESNLHDTITQYVRIIGETPSSQARDVQVDFDLPPTPEVGVEEAMYNNPLLFSYAENSQSAYYAIEEQKSAFRPRFDIRAGTAHDIDQSGTDGWRRKSYIELVMTYNVYNGGRDRANLHRTEEQHKEAVEIFKKLQRDIVQSVHVSYNDIVAYGNQLPSLKQHSDSADATRVAYVRQFEAGRRSLLDLLDSENEYYQAELAYVNADYNQRTAKADYLASTGKLLEHYAVEREDVPARDAMGYEPEDSVFSIVERKRGK